MSKPVVFLGPTLPVDAARELLDADYRAPVSQGDVTRALAGRPPAIAIIDGYFHRVPAVWHKEILAALASGTPVFGASSMGALRAAELHAFGMRGVGRVFEDFAAGALTADDEVAVVHGPAETGYAALSEALVNVRATVAAARAAGVLNDAGARAIVDAARTTFYPRRTYASVVARARADGLDASSAERFVRFAESEPVDQKRIDAVALLRLLSASDEIAAARPGAFAFERTMYWEMARREAARDGLAGGTGDAAVLEEARLTGECDQRTILAALARRMLNDEAERGEALPSRAAVGETLARLRRRHGLENGARASAWFAEQHLSGEALARVLVQEALCGQRSRGPEAAEALVSELKASGRYAELRARAERKAAALADAGAEQTVAASGCLDSEDLFRWFFAQADWYRGTRDPDALETALGFAGAAAFETALRREHAFASLRTR
jgi:hypothetical protein